MSADNHLGVYNDDGEKQKHARIKQKVKDTIEKVIKLFDDEICVLVNNMCDAKIIYYETSIAKKLEYVELYESTITKYKNSSVYIYMYSDNLCESPTKILICFDKFIFDKKVSIIKNENKRTIAPITLNTHNILLNTTNNEYTTNVYKPDNLNITRVIDKK
jgi:virulence-associated protein VagC